VRTTGDRVAAVDCAEISVVAGHWTVDAISERLVTNEVVPVLIGIARVQIGTLRVRCAVDRIGAAFVVRDAATVFAEIGTALLLMLIAKRIAEAIVALVTGRTVGIGRTTRRCAAGIVAAILGITLATGGAARGVAGIATDARILVAAIFRAT
jgi:hypothetical protein